MERRTGDRRILLLGRIGVLENVGRRPRRGCVTNDAESVLGVIRSPSIRLPAYGEQAVTIHSSCSGALYGNYARAFRLAGAFFAGFAPGLRPSPLAFASVDR